MSLTSGMYMVAPPWSQSWHTEVQQHELWVIVCCKGHLHMITCTHDKLYIHTYVLHQHPFSHYSLVAPFIVYCIHSVNNMNFTLPTHIRTCTYIYTHADLHRHTRTTRTTHFRDLNILIWFHISYFGVSFFCFMLLVCSEAHNEWKWKFLLIMRSCYFLFHVVFASVHVSCSMCSQHHSVTLSIYHYSTNEHLTSSITALCSHHNVLACSSLAPIVSMQIAMLGLGMGKQAKV